MQDIWKIYLVGITIALCAVSIVRQIHDLYCIYFKDWNPGFKSKYYTYKKILFACIYLYLVFSYFQIEYVDLFLGLFLVGLVVFYTPFILLRNSP